MIDLNLKDALGRLVRWQRAKQNLLDVAQDDSIVVRDALYAIMERMDNERDEKYQQSLRKQGINIKFEKRDVG